MRPEFQSLLEDVVAFHDGKQTRRFAEFTAGGDVESAECLADALVDWLERYGRDGEETADFGGHDQELTRRTIACAGSLPGFAEMFHFSSSRAMQSRFSRPSPRTSAGKSASSSEAASPTRDGPPPRLIRGTPAKSGTRRWRSLGRRACGSCESPRSVSSSCSS